MYVIYLYLSPCRLSLFCQMIELGSKLGLQRAQCWIWLTELGSQPNSKSLIYIYTRTQTLLLYERIGPGADSLKISFQLRPQFEESDTFLALPAWNAGGPLLYSKALCQQLRVVLLNHHSILHHRPPWLGMRLGRSLQEVLHTPPFRRKAVHQGPPRPVGFSYCI